MIGGLTSQCGHLPSTLPGPVAVGKGNPRSAFLTLWSRTLLICCVLTLHVSLKHLFTQCLEQRRPIYISNTYSRY
jgi:hypothetical protein